MPQISQDILDLAARREPGFSIERDWYVRDDIYRAEVDGIWRRGWLFAAHACEMPNPGDYQLFDFDGDSIILLRDDDGDINAFHNVCRHRGTVLCNHTQGHVGSLVCPYHQWVYGRDGSLKSCRGMHDIDKSNYGLHTIHVVNIEGMVYINFAQQPSSIDSAVDLMGPLLKPQGLNDAKVATQVDYEIDANWKLVWENNRECYHCNVNHPQYIKANFDHYNEDDTSPRIAEHIAAVTQKSESKWQNAGLAVTHKETGMTCFPDAKNNIWFSANRTPLVDGWVSESMDGKQVAPLMGQYTEPDVGTLRVRTLPNMWNHSSCDHAVTTRLLPLGRNRTQARVTWLVHKDAEEGLDYQLDRIMPFWQLTSEQDWTLCADAQRGVSSTAYRPGPLSKHKEYNVDSFLAWCMNQLQM